MSTSPSTSTSSTYNNLLTLLHPPSPSPPLEIEILPPSHAPHILSAPSPPCIGIPKKTLLACFLLARQIYLDKDAKNVCQDKEEVLRATKILTLWEPNWGSAWVLRRRWLSAFALRLGARAGGGEGRGSSIVGTGDTSIGMQMGSLIKVADERWRRGKIKEAVEGELGWVETLVRSPLCGKHAKSSWVWAHRRWVLTEFYGEVADGCTGDRGGGAGAFVKRELEIVMVAGKRHARNYYAWEFAREVVRMAGARLGNRGWEEVVWMVHHWCLMHPRDISGRDIFGRTRDFVEKFGWKGESVEWFLKSASHFHINSHD